MTKPDEPASGWEKLRIGANAIGAVAIPVIVGLIGWQVNASVKERDAEIKMIEMAVGILQAKPDPEATTGLREWAVDLIDRHSEVAISSEARDELVKRPLPMSAEIAASKVESALKAIEKLTTITTP